MKALADEKTATESRLERLKAKWQAEMDVATKVRETRQEIQELHAKGPIDPAELSKKQAALRELEAELGKARGSEPLVQISVDALTICDVISGWTGIPTGRMQADEVETVLHLKDHLGKRIVGQDHALEAIAQRIRTAHAGIEDPSKPVRGSSCSRGPAASARPRRPSPCPNSCTASRRTW